MKKKKFTTAVNIVRASIHRINPYSLLEGGSPEDELDSEINSITSQLHRCNSGKDVSLAIARVLSSTFSEKHLPEDFEKEGYIIYNSLIENQLK